MSTQFVYGRPGQKMDRWLDEAAVAAIAEDATLPVYVITPRPSTYGTESRIMREFEAPGLMGLQVTSMDRLAEDILASVYGGAMEFVNTAGKSMLIRGILDVRREDLTAFQSIASAPELPAAIAAQIARFKQTNISAEELEEYAGRHPEKLRLGDLALIYSDLEKLMEGRIDSEGAMNLAIDHVKEAWFLDQAFVILRGFNEWSAQQIRFAEALMRTAARVIVELPRVDDDQPDHSIYGASEQAALHLLPSAGSELTFKTISDDRPSPIVETACELFYHGPRHQRAGDAMEICGYESAEQEVRAVAAEIVRLHEEEGMNFEDVAIVWGETQEYEPLIRRIFEEANIPCFNGEKKTLADSNLAEFVLTASELIGGQLRKEALLAHAATGFTALEPQELSILTNYARMMVSWGREFEKPFDVARSLKKGFRDDVKEAEKARRKVMQPILRYLRGKDRARRPADVLTALEEYVTHVLTEDSIQAKAEGMQTEYEQVSFMEQSVKAILLILGQAHELLGDSDMEISQLRRVLRAGFEAVELALVPAAVDEVLSGSLMRTYVPAVSHLFVVGVQDEVLPHFGEISSDLLTSAEWSGLVRELKNFEPQSNVEAQKYRIVRTMLQARRKIHWSYNDGAETKPSMLIDHLKQLYQNDGADESGMIPRNTLKERILYLKQNAYDVVVSQVRDVADGAQGNIDRELARAILFDPAFAVRTEQLGFSLTHPNEAVPAPPQDPLRTFSATRLQTYGACPYRHFVRYQLNAWNPPSAVIGSQATGQFMHGVLDDVTRKIDGRWNERSDDEFEIIVAESVSKEIIDQIGEDPYPRNWARLDAVTPRVIEAATAMRQQQLEAALAPIASEVDFLLSLGSEGNQIQGIVDRIDMASLSDSRYLSVIDYKSSRHDFSIGDLILGTDVQLIIYLLAVDQLIRNGKTVGRAKLEVSDRIAGGGFVNLLPQLSDPAPAAIEAAYRIAGLLAVPPETAKVLYGSSDGKLASFDHGITLKGQYHANGSWRIFFSEADVPGNRSLQALLTCGREVLGRSMDACTAGHNAISPARTECIACDYCEYNSICRFERDAPDSHIRMLPKQTQAQRKDELLIRYGNVEDPL